MKQYYVYDFIHNKIKFLGEFDTKEEVDICFKRHIIKSKGRCMLYCNSITSTLTYSWDYRTFTNKRINEIIATLKTEMEGSHNEK